MCNDADFYGAVVASAVAALLFVISEVAALHPDCPVNSVSEALVASIKKLFSEPQSEFRNIEEWRRQAQTLESSPASSLGK